MQTDKIIKVELFPCAGSVNGNFPKNHIYAVDGILGSGKRITYIDFTTPEAARNMHADLEIIVMQDNHRTCPDCMRANFYPRLSREEIISRFYLNHGKFIRDIAIVN